MKRSSHQWPLSWFSYHPVSDRLFFLITFPLVPSSLSSFAIPFLEKPFVYACLCGVCFCKSQSSPCLRSPVSSHARRTGPQAWGGLSCLCFPSCSGNIGLRDVCYWTCLYVDSVDLHSDPYACAARALPTDPSPQLWFIVSSVDLNSEPLAYVAWRFSPQSHFPGRQTLYLRKVFFFLLSFT